jgi:single-stranded-DNA-specific exonuclease
MTSLHPIVDHILTKRGIDDRESFLNPVYDDRPDPFLMRDMDVAAARILRALEHNEKIAAWTDYDCDGIPAGALISDFFATIGHPVRSYIPERSEGYGLNVSGIRALKEEGVSLIITADCGITDVEQVAYANSLGIDVIVSDHHMPQETLPAAVAVLNPHRTDCDYPFKELSGTGVAFKLIEAIIQKGNCDIPRGFEKWFLDLVALATVADMVPVVGENRVLVHFGLLVLRKGRRIGMRALCDAMRVPYAHVTEDDIAFSIAPKINASSRMESPRLALELLTTTDTSRAQVLAKQLVKLNDARKLEGARVSKEVKRRLEGVSLANVIVLGNTSWNPALLGIAAQNVVETYQKTVCLWGMDGELIKGSCRSNGTVNIVSLMSAVPEVFENFGGHEASGGFSLKKEVIHTLPDTLEKAYQRIETNPLPDTNTVDVDGALTLAEVHTPLYRALRALAPFGVGHAKPVFSFRSLRIENIWWFGKHKEHVRLTVSDESQKSIDAISFFAQRARFHDTLTLLSPGDMVDIDAVVEESFFMGKRALRLRFETLCLATGTMRA